MSEQVTAVSAILEDGGQVNIRPANAGDEPELAAFYARLGVHDGHPWSPRGRSVAAGVGHKAALVPIGQSVTAWANDELIGVADYRTLRSTREAEVTVAVTGRWRGRGIETLLLEHLVSSARQRGIESFHADVQADNSEMLPVLANLGLTGQAQEPSGASPGHANRGLLGSRRRRSGSVAFDLSLRYDERYLEAVAERESRADVLSLRRVFAPRSVAIAGASRREVSVGNAVVRHLLEADFHGPVYPVNPHAGRIAGLRAYPSVSALPEVPDLVVVAVPALAVAGVAEECGQCGVGGLVVLSAGFSDLDAGRLRQAVRHYGMRMVGPNCIGIANTDPAVALDATFTRQIAAPGSVGVLTQSGGIGFAISESLHGARLGVSTFASVGNEYDVSGNDLLLWWRHDDRTKVAIIYLESFGNPRKFARLARQLGRRIPVVVMRAGASEVAQQAARSHTAATATPAVIRDELFRQAGVVATDDLAEAIDAVAFFSWQPLPAGRRVALVCNTGAGVLAADTCARFGLRVPPLSPATQEALAAILPAAGGAVTNPVDTTAGVSAELFGRVLQTVAADPGIDAIVPILTPTAVSPTEQILDSLAVQAPVAAVLLGQREALALHGRVPVYSSATAAIRALSHAADYAATRSRETGTVPQITGIDKDAAEVAIGAYLTGHPEGGWLDGAVLDAIARAYGLPAAPSMIVHDTGEAADALTAFGGRVAMKALAPGLVHRSDEHAVVLDVQTAAEARSAYRRLAASFGDSLSGVLVQQMVPPGTEMLIGFVQDPVFGPLVQVGAGGVTTDLVKDRSARLLPLTDRDARDMIGSLRMAPLLTGYRDAPPLDVAALTDVLHRVARLAADLPSVAELDINPLILCPSGCTAVDTKIRVAPAHVIDPYLRELH
jgi:acyl-CoA synthetase (NDP forming)/GNAT superfamily N-acetyltransferase